MQIEITLDAHYAEPKIVVFTAELTPEITAIVDRLSSAQPVSFLIGHREEQAVPLQIDDIARIYTEGQQVLAQTADGVFSLRRRLYELEALCRGTALVRISNAEIVNFNKVKSLDLSIAGTITLHLSNNRRCFVSRRYVAKIKQYLGL